MTGDRKVWYQRGGIWIVGQCYPLVESIADTHKRTLAGSGQVWQGDSRELEGRYLHMEIIEWIDYCHHKGGCIVWCMALGVPVLPIKANWNSKNDDQCRRQDS